MRTVPERQLAHTPYLSAWEGIDSAELSDRERAVLKTTDTPGWQILRDLWDKREKALTDHLIGLRPDTSPEQYAAAVAHIKGLREALEVPQALATVAEQRRQEAEAAHA